MRSVSSSLDSSAQSDLGRVALGGPPTLGTCNTITDSRGHPGIGSLPAVSLSNIVSSSPKRGHPGLGMHPPESVIEEDFPQQVRGRVLQVKTIGELKAPDIGSSALASPLGSVPSLKRSKAKSMEVLPGAGPRPLAAAVPLSGRPQTGIDFGVGSVPDLTDEQPAVGLGLTLGGGRGGPAPGLGSIPGIGGHPGLGSVPGQAGHPALGGGHSGLGSRISGQELQTPNRGDSSGGFAGLGGHPGLGTIPGRDSAPVPTSSVAKTGAGFGDLGGHPGLGMIPSQTTHRICRRE